MQSPVGAGSAREEARKPQSKPERNHYIVSKSFQTALMPASKGLNRCSPINPYSAYRFRSTAHPSLLRKNAPNPAVSDTLAHLATNLQTMLSDRPEHAWVHVCIGQPIALPLRSFNERVAFYR